MVRAGVQMRTDGVRDLLRSAVRDHGVDQPVGPAGGDVALVEAQRNRLLV